MCGFAGFVGSPDRELLEKMGERISHRGPDQRGEWSDDHCSLTHRRLAIIDLSEAGRQPMQTADGRFVIAYNGELYNYRELRRRYEARGWKFQTQTDTECFLASVALTSLSDLQDFHGMFAFVIWDRDEHVAYAARDRMGIKPLYVTSGSGRTAFASEVGALLSVRPAWDLDETARSMFFTLGYVPGPRTMWKDLSALEPGVLHAVTEQGIERVRSFRMPDSSSPGPSSMRRGDLTWSEAIERLRELVDSAVERQLVSDRPVGVFLSGGLDSSVVLSSMREAQPGAVIKTFTTRFRHETSDPKFNRDAELARQTAARYGCEHHEIDVGPEDLMREAETIARHLGQPHNNHSVMALDAAARLASQHVPVVLSGDGGDESFGGYERYRLYGLIAPFLKHGFGRAALRLVSSAHSRGTAWADLLQSRDEAGRMLAFHAAPQAVRRQLFGEIMDDAAVIELWNRLLSSVISRSSSDEKSPLRPAEWGDLSLRRTPFEMTKTSKDPVARFMALDRETWLRDDAFVRSDRLTMRHGLELRVPLTDDALVALASSLPRRFHVTRRETKRLWRAAFADRCLPEVLSEPKRGWFPPSAKWLRTGLKEWARDLIEEAIASHGWMQGDAIRKAWEDHLAGRGYYLNEIWMVLAWQLWWREYENHLR